MSPPPPSDDATHDQQGLHVLVTRPEPDNTHLCNALKSHNWVPTALPLITFDVERPPHAFDAQHTPLSGETLIQAVARADQIIVVSPRAVHFGIPWISQHAPQVLTRSIWLSIGPATTRALNAHGITASNPPTHGLTSETLLTSPTLLDTAPAQNIVILRGAEGRQTLHETLQARGHRILSLDVYRRRAPTYTVTTLSKALNRTYDCYTCTSGEILQNLISRLRQWGPTTPPPRFEGSRSSPTWLDTPLLVVGYRQSTLAQQAGFRHCVIAPTADTNTLVDTLNHWRANRRIDEHHEQYPTR